MNSCILVACLAVVAVLSAGSTNARPNHQDTDEVVETAEAKGVNDLVKFDYVIFRQIWPNCMFPNHHSCGISKNVSTWVVHGMWPSIYGEIGPLYCQKIPFDFSTLKWQLPRLLEFWPNLYTDTPEPSFWEHEWTKHGVCAVQQLPGIENESDYFKTSMDKRDLIDFGKVLAAKNIVPDDEKEYSLKEIHTALIDEFKTEPGIVCDKHKHEKVQYLSQMQVCLTKQFGFEDCRPTSEPECDPDVPIIYPTIKH